MSTAPQFQPHGRPAPGPPLAAPGAEVPQAVAALSEAFKREPELIRALLEGGESQPLECRQTILAAARAAAADCPTHADLLYRAAEAATACGEYALAEDALQQALALNPGYRDALILAARVALARHQPQQAITYLTAAIEYGADYPDVHTLLGHAWSELGQTRQARSAYQRACQLNPGLREARAALAALDSTPARGADHELPA